MSRNHPGRTEEKESIPNQGNFKKPDQKKNRDSVVEQMQDLPEWQKRQHWLTQLGVQS